MHSPPHIHPATPRPPPMTLSSKSRPHNRHGTGDERHPDSLWGASGLQIESDGLSAILWRRVGYCAPLLTIGSLLGRTASWWGPARRGGRRHGPPMLRWSQCASATPPTPLPRNTHMFSAVGTAYCTCSIATPCDVADRALPFAPVQTCPMARTAEPATCQKAPTTPMDATPSVNGHIHLNMRGHLERPPRPPLVHSRSQDPLPLPDQGCASAGLGLKRGFKSGCTSGHWRLVKRVNAGQWGWGGQRRFGRN